MVCLLKPIDILFKVMNHPDAFSPTKSAAEPYLPEANYTGRYCLLLNLLSDLGGQDYSFEHFCKFL